MALLLLIFFLLLGYAHFRFRRRRMEALAAKIAGPPAWPIIGNAFEFLGSTHDVLSAISRLLRRYQTPTAFWFGPRLYVAVSRPADIEAVLTSPHALEKDPVYRFLEPWLGHGLFTAPVSTWRVNRRLIMPTFNPRNLERFVDVFSAQTQIMVHKLAKEVGRGAFDVFRYVNLCSLDTICETAMGLGVRAQDDNNSDYVRSAERLSQIVAVRIFKAWLHPDWVFNLTSLGRDHARELRYANHMTATVVQRRRLEHSLRSDDDDDDDDDVKDGGASQKVFLDLLLEQTGTRMSDQQLKDETTTMIVAGNDTTATMTSFALLVLAIQRAEQDKVYEELRRIFGDSKRAATSRDLREMQYLELCIKETMRMFPVAPLIGRRLTADVQLEDAVVPAGSSVVVCIQHLHMDPEFFPDPHKFIPERFLPDNKRHPFSYVPFSAGPRNCVGLRYAMLLMKTMVSTVLRHYEISTPLKMADVQLKVDILLKSVRGYPVVLEPRTARNGCS
ncbi:cytochrome P450 4C1-like isoform X1 [Zootermopsis nevadensis]|uniref:cytochrome P450 4C1-like isoform X1 n=1 Tax=Zootermopsis nevadensis TaxID=136037 RepID=UPI000B8E9634|nr:cytochrome P450 4C1-like isoform X1 [Zootermopsis nevadensis]XP_021940759.1 cytochrome P450 4C1-like isoform X2 [Zootermopsis nevadensis]XP_021940760.1 cytochrome P450 4C1-like isoform X1 [Zootermopsis nevadensis]